MRIMRNLTFILACMLTMCATIACADNDRPIEISKLPANARQFINQHFSSSKVALAKVETEFMSKNYGVMFSDGNHIEFDGNGNWTEVDCKQTVVPSAVIPIQISDYLRVNYPDASVIKIERDRRKYEVKLSNRMELKFDMKFRLIDIDM